MDGIAKTATPTPKTEAPAHKQVDQPHLQEAVVHPEMYKYFNVNPLEDKDNDQLRYISNNVQAKSAGELLKSISAIERKLGEPKVGESRLGRVYNWLRMNQSYNNTKSELNTHLTQIQDKYKSQVKQLKSQMGEKVKAIDSEIKVIQEKHRNAVRVLKTNMTNEARRVKQEYENQLKELRAMRSAYGG